VVLRSRLLARPFWFFETGGVPFTVPRQPQLTKHFTDLHNGAFAWLRSQRIQQKRKSMSIFEVIENSPIPWTVARFAKVTGVSTDHIYDLIKAGTLPAFCMGAKILLDPDTTAQWLRNQRTIK